MMTYSAHGKIVQYVNSLKINAVPQTGGMGNFIGYKICSDSLAQEYGFLCLS